MASTLTWSLVNREQRPIRKAGWKLTTKPLKPSPREGPEASLGPSAPQSCGEKSGSRAHSFGTVKRVSGHHALITCTVQPFQPRECVRSKPVTRLSAVSVLGSITGLSPAPASPRMPRRLAVAGLRQGRHWPELEGGDGEKCSAWGRIYLQHMVHGLELGPPPNRPPALAFGEGWRGVSALSPWHHPSLHLSSQRERHNALWGMLIYWLPLRKTNKNRLPS